MLPATTDIEKIFLSAVASVHPRQLMQRNIVIVSSDTILVAGHPYSIPSHNQIWIIGAGKAAAAMAKEAEEILHPVFIPRGLIVTKYGHGLALQYLEQIEAGHPVPDTNSVSATVKLQEIASQVKPGDLVLFLLSGGASSLLADVPEGSTLAAIQELFEALLKSGADIREINIVRKHFSAIKGGQLARRLAPARVCSLILSDVVGDDLSIIGSGPTVGDPSTFADSLAILEKYGITHKIHPSLLQHIQKGIEGKIPDTPKPGSSSLSYAHNYLIGSNAIALTAAEKAAQEAGYTTKQLSSDITGEADSVAKWLVDTALKYKGPLPACLLAGGETTVTVTGKGKGGRNQQLALAAGIQLEKYPQLTVLSGGTDGNDGPTTAAGAIVNAPTIVRAKEQKLDPQAFLKDNDAFNFFSKAGGLLVTGPTNTNVMDIMIVLITEPGA